MSDAAKITEIFFSPMKMGSKPPAKRLSNEDGKEFEKEIYPHIIEKIEILLPLIGNVPNFMPATTEIPEELLSKLTEDERNDREHFYIHSKLGLG